MGRHLNGSLVELINDSPAPLSLSNRAGHVEESWLRDDVRRGVCATRTIAYVTHFEVNVTGADGILDNTEIDESSVPTAIPDYSL